MNNIVSLVKCAEYEQSLVDAQVKACIDNLGGIDQFVKAGQNVVLKVNLVSKASPEKSATTHPSVVEAVGKLCQSIGAKVTIADSAGGAYTPAYMGAIYQASGMRSIADKCGFAINDNYESYEANYPDAKVNKKFLICDVLQKADVIINLTKLKTHGFTGMTNAVKNMFGAIPGLVKVEMHGQYRTLANFGEFLYDIQDYFKPKLVLHVTDAVYGMEGEGPTNGTPRKIGAILASTNPVAVDVVASRLIGFDPSVLPLNMMGVERGYITSIDDVQIVGEDVTPMIVADYQRVMPDDFRPFGAGLPRWIQPIIHRLTTRRPYINKSKCKGCKKCFEHCPVKAISMVDYKKGQPKKAEVDYNKCIRCFCCQELCPFGIVKIKSGLVYKVIHLKK